MTTTRLNLAAPIQNVYGRNTPIVPQWPKMNVLPTQIDVHGMTLNLFCVQISRSRVHAVPIRSVLTMAIKSVGPRQVRISLILVPMMHIILFVSPFKPVALTFSRGSSCLRRSFVLILFSPPFESHFWIRSTSSSGRKEGSLRRSHLWTNSKRLWVFQVLWNCTSTR